MADPSWYESIVKSLREQAGSWFVGVIIALLTVFSTRIVESLKFALNRADLRAKNYETMSMDLSEFLFMAELNQEFLRHGWTTRDSLTGLIQDYNKAITNIRKMEYVYSAWVNKYWGKTEADGFSRVMGLIRAFDQEIHRLNDEFEAVNIAKTRDKVDPAKAKEAADRMEPLLQQLRERTHALLLMLQ